MTKKEIERMLLPRFEVIADYPNSNWSIGEIITDAGEFSTKHIYRKYPHLFRELDYWEKRTEEEMPKYVKSEQWGRVFKVLSHFAGLHKEQCKVYDGKIDRRMRYENLLPATEAEYKGEWR